MTFAPSLWKISQEQQELNALLFEAEGELTPELEERLAINEANLEAKAEDYAVSMDMLKASAEAARQEIKRLTAYVKRCENAEERMKQALTTAMEICERDRLEVGTYRLSFRKSEAVVIIDELAIPNDYVKVETKIDKAQLGVDLKAGATINGAYLEQRRNLQIK